MAIGRVRTDPAQAVTGPTFHSYQGQDRFVLAACGGQRGGFFLDSGASDGLHGSNTRTLEVEYGWTGICIEPNTELHARLVSNRNCICLDCCLYDREGDVEFFEAAQVYGGIVDEYDPGHLEFARAFVARQPSDSASSAAPVTKSARTIRSVLQEFRAPRVIDYWSLDTEGSELAILRAFPFEEYRVRFLTVEHNHTPIRAAISAFLAGHGFQRVVDLGIDDGYAWVGNQAGAGWRSPVWSRAGRRLNLRPSA
ncbi:FkbM family methyltransferase [Jatrophihabitans sp.]|jgi:FkbM family methyltransferase|uniref:FkbM family methyltransferase n=1 Tax=Jatrophihabitans sp. TaxID=1932789 RepID=UPI002F0164F0